MESVVPCSLLVLGPPAHGVVDYAADLARAVRRRDPRVRELVAADAREAMALTRGAEAVHLHATDRILGSSPEEAAEAVEALARGTRLTLTLHDLPQDSDGAWLARRSEAYRRMAAAAAGVVVSSRHEARLAAGLLAGEPAVIPLGVRRSTAPTSSRRVDDAGTPPAVLLAGWIYPGKGHAEAIAAAAAVAVGERDAGGASAVVRAIGGASRGHEDELDALAELAAAGGVRFEATGSLGEDAYREALDAPGVPLAAHRHLSASRSVLDWIEAGRRPLILDSGYARELEELRPGCVRRIRLEDLGDAIRAAWADPASTRLAPGAPLGPTLDDVAAEHLGWWATA